MCNGDTLGLKQAKYYKVGPSRIALELKRNIETYNRRMRLRLLASEHLQRHQSHRSKGRTSEHTIESCDCD